MPSQSDTDPDATTKAGGGSSNNPAGPGDQGATDKQNGKTPATLADIAASEERQKQALATQYQGVQSLLDRQSGSLKEALEPVTDQLAAMEAMGIEVTPAQAEQLKQTAMMKALTKSDEEKGPDGKPLQPGEKPDETTPTGEQTQMGKLAMGMMQEQGVVILPTDAELELIDQETKDPKVFMDSMQDAIDAKIKRLANPDATGDDVTVTGPRANPRGKGNKANTVLPEKTPSGARTGSLDYLSAGYQESDKFPSGE
jgi:hypothetical protein